MSRTSIFEQTPLAFCLLLATFMLFPDIPSWSFATGLVFWFYRLVLERSQWRPPSRWMTGSFSLLFLAITYLSFRTLIGKEFSSSYLVVLLGLKVLEYEDQRENGFLILLGLYLLTSKFLFDTEMVWFSLGFPAMMVLLFYLLPESFRRQSPKEASLYLLQKLLLASPMAIFLFVYFPRFSNDMFLINTKMRMTGAIGFAEDIEPGSVAALAATDEVAFRAEFIGLKPTINNLYWRGLTLTKAKGMKWQRDPQMEPQEESFSVISVDTPHVRITMEPTFKPWLFSLDQTTSLVTDGDAPLVNPLGVFKLNRFVDKRIVYRLQSVQEITRPQRSGEGQLIVESPIEPQIKSLIASMKKKANTPKDYLKAISDYYTENRFQYTLEPGDEGTLSLRDFLFKTRKGFCEHYSSATALLLNALGVPARVLVGYHGGEFNPLGRFWTIRQRDAHSWIEYLDENKEWHRFDPTAIVAPLRLSLGATAFEDSLEGTLTELELARLSDPEREKNILQRLLFAFENLNHRWNFFFINFNIDKQKELMEQLGVNLGLAIVIGVFATLIVSLLLSWLLRTRQKTSRSERIFNLINKALSPYQLESMGTEAPLAWQDRIIKALPSSKTTIIKDLFSCYIAEAYEKKSDHNNLKRAKKLSRLL